MIDSRHSKVQAILYSPVPPTNEQRKNLIEFLKDKYKRVVTLSWKEDKTLREGFRLEVGTVSYRGETLIWTLDSVYDWSLESRLLQLRDDILKLKHEDDQLIPLVKETLKDWTPRALEQEFGTVLNVGDGIARVGGLPNVRYQEILIFSSGIRGMVQEIRRDEIGCILFDDGRHIAEGSIVKRTGRAAGIPVGDQFKGRVIDALGKPIDGLGPIKEDSYRPIESPAPSVTDREPVRKPMETGILAIDALYPIGHGQRELIIGDRQTGKTTIALDTILNQKGKDVVCIYVAIGQKASSVAQTVDILRRNGAMDYTIVVNTSASDPAPLQYIAPYAGCALGEYFMYHGQRVLIVYDDLTKHAIAHRSLSLLLERSPGREAYPGDVFYLHSRLLERSGQLSKEKGGGSMTALPIVETQAGDVSAYIPTNIISITDGQIYLESDLFFSGQRPAINIGLSVSRVGGDAQSKAMKKAVGSLRLELAQYKEMEVFMQFASELDDNTKKQLAFGQGLMYLLRQAKHKPLRQAEQVVLLVTALSRLMQDIPLKEIEDLKEGLLAYFRDNAPHIYQEINQSGELKEDLKESILLVSQEYLSKARQVQIRDA